MAKRLVIILLGTMSVGAPLTVFAAAPMPFDKWSVNNGIISAQCTTGVECRAPMTAPGMLQRELNSGGGKFIQSVITNANATGTASTLSFSSESFVKQGWSSSDSVNGVPAIPGESNIVTTGGSISGIALKQTLSEPASLAITKQGDFSLTTLIHTGWADDTATPTVEIKQHNGSNLASVQWANDFWFRQNVDANGNQTGMAWDIGQLGQTLRMYDPLKALEKMPNDVMRFDRRRRAGDLNPGRLGGGISGGGSSDSGSSSIPAFTAGGDAQVTWFGMYYTGGEGQTSIGYQSYDNLNDTTPGTFAFDKEGAPGRPWSWDNMFGAMPTMPFSPPRGGD